MLEERITQLIWNNLSPCDGNPREVAQKILKAIEEAGYVKGPQIIKQELDEGKIKISLAYNTEGRLEVYMNGERYLSREEWNAHVDGVVVEEPKIQNIEKARVFYRERYGINPTKNDNWDVFPPTDKEKEERNDAYLKAKLAINEAISNAESYQEGIQATKEAVKEE